MTPEFSGSGLSQSNPVQVLLSGLIDYAGLFPPAQLGMNEAIRRYADYLVGQDAHALGRFILPLGRLPEFELEYAGLYGASSRHWKLSVLAGPDPELDCALIAKFNTVNRHVRIVSVEAKASTVADIARLAMAFPPTLEVWIELPVGPDPTPLVQAIKSVGRRAKLRTGGVTQGAFPLPTDILRFLRACLAANVVCKVTAGLHHPVRGVYPLTEEPGSARGTMFGFLNIFLAAALIRQGGSDAAVLDLLHETESENFSNPPGEITWRGFRFTATDLSTTRQQLCRSFGSCSFTEPLAGLRSLRWL